jgi:hypothetical protein
VANVVCNGRSAISSFITAILPGAKIIAGASDRGSAVVEWRKRDSRLRKI